MTKTFIVMVMKDYNILKKKGIFTTMEACDMGFSQPTVSRLAAQGVLVRLDRGLFKHVDADIHPKDEEFALGCHLFGGKSYVGAYTALFDWGLADAPPQVTWMLIPYSTRPKRVDCYKSIQTKMSFSVGILNRRFYRIAGLERSILEVMKYHKRFGWPTAVNAAREALKGQMTTLGRLGDMSRKLGLEKVFQDNIEAIELG